MSISVASRSNVANRENPQFSGSNVSIGHVFKTVRQELGLSQKTFAAALNVDYVWLSKLENDRLPITDEAETAVTALLPALAEIIPQLDLDWLRSQPIVCLTPASDAAFTCYVRDLK